MVSSVLLSMVSLQVKKLSSFASIRGQMFRKKIEPVYFETRFGIHTFFVQHPIDVLILDSTDVVQKVKDLLPWKIFLWNPKWKRVVELPGGTIQNRKIKVGTRIVLEVV